LQVNRSTVYNSPRQEHVFLSHRWSSMNQWLSLKFRLMTIAGQITQYTRVANYEAKRALMTW